MSLSSDFSRDEENLHPNNTERGSPLVRLPLLAVSARTTLASGKGIIASLVLMNNPEISSPGRRSAELVRINTPSLEMFSTLALSSRLGE